MRIPKRIFAVDWSGASDKASIKKKIWLAEVDSSGLKDLRAGFGSRLEVADYLIDAAVMEPDLVVGLDFAFSFPSWFVKKADCSSVVSFWDYAEEQAEVWLNEPHPSPFYKSGKPPTKDPFRRTELWAAKQVPRQRPDNVFHMVGAKQVGKGSVRGMPVLRRLRAAGFSIWPFDSPKLPCVVEIYPRLFYGSLKKSSVRHRIDYLEPLSIPDKYHRAQATCSDDAFDAATSALKMFERRSELAHLTQASDDVELIEGRIWS